MCGICGIALGPRAADGVDGAMIERMRDVMTHRGPDGAGVYVGHRVGLGHRRLSIIDVAHGAQPMASDDGRIQLVYNGEVFNHPTLSADLRAAGVQYHTHCDTETILRLYEREGARIPERLRGMFAIAIWDARSGELFLIRDRFGVKPLYYAHLADGTLVFGSEIKSILASGLLAARLNEGAVPDFLANYAPSGEETLFAGIRRLPPGTVMRWHEGSIEVRQYWDLHYGPEETGRDADLVAEYRERFIEAVRLRLMSDVPLGMFLSGGIDSAAITAAMSRLVADPIKTFSVAFAEREANELYYARLVATRYRTDHHEIVVTPGQFWGAVPRLVWHEDEPMAHPSSVALNFVSRLAAEHVKVVLTGEGSDETLGGYNRYRVTVLNQRLARIWARTLPASLRGAVQRRVEGRAAAGVIGRKLSRTFLALPNDLTALYFDNFAVFNRARQAGFLSPDFHERTAQADPYLAARAALNRADATTLLDRLLYADTKTYLHELLMKQDQMSMAASIESRVPFLDHPLVEFTASLPERLKLRRWTTKYVLRAAMRDLLPAEILSRRKMGFPVPIGPWLRGQFRPVIDEFVTGPRPQARGLFRPEAVAELVSAHLSGREDHGQRLWALVNLEIWHRLFLEGEPVDAIRVPGT